jgi:gamma-glutamylcyclotransferase (GGCT)/AIG2-like uncharacterized protein YtfP
MNEPNHLFCYGTLKRGFCNAHFLESECEFVASATVPYRMYAHVRIGVLPKGKRVISAPMLSRAPGVCYGEVWRLPTDALEREDLLRRLDWLEGVEYGWYTRERVIVCTPVYKNPENGEPLPCFIYFHNQPQGEVFKNWAEGESK